MLTAQFVSCQTLHSILFADMNSISGVFVNGPIEIRYVRIVELYWLARITRLFAGSVGSRREWSLLISWGRLRPTGGNNKRLYVMDAERLIMLGRRIRLIKFYLRSDHDIWFVWIFHKIINMIMIILLKWVPLLSIPQILSLRSLPSDPPNSHQW